MPVIVDLATLRSAAVARGLPPEQVNPLVPVHLIVDHSVQVDSYGSPRSLLINLDKEYERNHERYRFLQWAKTAYSNYHIVPPGNGICHQVNLEYLSQVVVLRGADGEAVAFPDTLLGTDSHTTMVNGLSVLGWGVGGIEAEAVMLGEPYTLPRPVVVGVELTGTLAPGATATDLVLTVTRRLRETGVVDQFVEFFGPGVDQLSVPDRATISNMCPEYGATAALFPIDAATIAYLRASGREPAQVARVEVYARATGLWGSPAPGSIDYDRLVRLDIGSVVPTIAGPRNPEEGVALSSAATSFATALASYRKGHPPAGTPVPRRVPPVDDGSVVIAAITSCTNTSNPTVMVGAGLIARNALAAGLRVPAHVKTSLAPGSKVVTAYLDRAGLLKPLADLGFALVGFGCTTCIGNSGPLPAPVSQQVQERDLYVAAVLSGNRNFEARIQNEVRANYLASPMLVVAYALAGRMNVNLTEEPLGHRPDGTPAYLRDLWPSADEVRTIVEASLAPSMFREKYAAIEVGDAHWESLHPPTGPSYAWSPDSDVPRRGPLSRASPSLAPPERGDCPGGSGAPGPRRPRDDRPHLTRGGDPRGNSRGAVPRVSRRPPRRVQHLRSASRSPRGAPTRDLRERSVEERPREAEGRWLHPPSSRRRGDDGVRRGRAVPKGEDPVARLRGEELRAGELAGLGGEGTPAPRGRGRDRGELRAESTGRTSSRWGSFRSAYRPGDSWAKLGLTGRETFDLRLPRARSSGPAPPSSSVQRTQRDERLRPSSTCGCTTRPSSTTIEPGASCRTSWSTGSAPRRGGPTGGEARLSADQRARASTRR